VSSENGNETSPSSKLSRLAKRHSSSLGLPGFKKNAQSVILSQANAQEVRLFAAELP
jgi:hypothetical protein